jgi:hypothetical protein
MKWPSTNWDLRRFNLYMQLLALRPYASGFRGCLIDSREYSFFQYGRKGRLKILKRYPKSDFSDLYHFIAMMQKFMTSSSMIVPPVPINALTLAELERVADEQKALRRRAGQADA